MATLTRKKEKSKQQHFYGHSSISPTPYEFTLQNLGSVISNVIALHIRDVKLGNLVAPTHPDDEDFEPDNADFGGDTAEFLENAVDEDDEEDVDIPRELDEPVPVPL